MVTLFSTALQCQVKDAFSVTQDKSGLKKVKALTTVCAGERSSMLNIVSCYLLMSIISWPFFFSFSHCQIIRFCVIEPNGDLGFFSILSSEDESQNQKYLKKKIAALFKLGTLNNL